MCSLKTRDGVVAITIKPRQLTVVPLYYTNYQYNRTIWIFYRSCCCVLRLCRNREFSSRSRDLSTRNIVVLDSRDIENPRSREVYKWYYICILLLSNSRIIELLEISTIENEKFLGSRLLASQLLTSRLLASQLLTSRLLASRLLASRRLLAHFYCVHALHPHSRLRILD